jgi:hypothetical protein
MILERSAQYQRQFDRLLNESEALAKQAVELDAIVSFIVQQLGEPQEGVAREVMQERRVSFFEMTNRVESYFVVRMQGSSLEVALKFANVVGAAFIADGIGPQRLEKTGLP